MTADKPVTTMNISLPKTMRAFVQERVAEGGYSSVSEYFRELVRKDEQTKAQDRLDRLLLEGVHSGRAAAMTREDWAGIRGEVRARLRRRSGRRRKSS